MKAYMAEKLFRIEKFPLMVTYAPQTSFMPPHYHDFIEIVLVGQGHSIHDIHTGTFGELSYGLIQGDVFSVMPGEIHKYSKSKNLIIYNLAFQKELIANDVDELAKLYSWTVLFNPNSDIARNKVHLALSEHLAAEKCLKRIILELSLKKMGFKLSAKTALLEFMIIVARGTAVEWKASVDAKSQGILGSIEAMRKSLETPFDLKRFAKTSAMSVSSYTKKFREATGISPLGYFIGMRMEKVCWFLSETNLSLSDIAFQCGFCDTNYMIKIFRIRQGITPAKYRRLVKIPRS